MGSTRSSLVSSCLLPLGALLAAGAFVGGCTAPTLEEPSGHTASHELAGTPAVGTASPAKPVLAVMYVHWNSTTGDFLTSIDPNDIDPTYKLTGADYEVMNQLQPPESRDQVVGANANATVALYRCRDAEGFHFQSVNKECSDISGGIVEGLLGYLWANDPGDGAKRAYRCVAPAGHFAISTVTIDQCFTGGFSVITPLGFAYAFDSNTGGSSRR